MSSPKVSVTGLSLESKVSVTAIRVQQGLRLDRDLVAW